MGQSGSTSVCCSQSASTAKLSGVAISDESDPDRITQVLTDAGALSKGQQPSDASCIKEERPTPDWQEQQVETATITATTRAPCTVPATCAQAVPEKKTHSVVPAELDRSQDNSMPGADIDVKADQKKASQKVSVNGLTKMASRRVSTESLPEPATDEKVQEQEKPKPKARKKEVSDPQRVEKVKKIQQKPTRKKDESSDSSDGERISSSCPASKQDRAFEKELKALKKKQKQKPGANLQHVQLQDPDRIWMSSEMSVSDRHFKKEMFLSFYREQYAAIGKAEVDTKHYPTEAIAGLKITEGHRPMPRPNGVKVPPDFRQPVGTLTRKQLAEKDSKSSRMLLSIHGDLFDVSDRPDKYGENGPYWYMTGHDITWSFVCADDAQEQLDRYYDNFKIQPKEKSERKLQGLLSWWAFYEKEYGQPVGRLDVYQTEWTLPPPPEDGLEDACCVM